MRSAGATRREDAIAYNAGYSHTRASTCNPRSTPPNPPRNTTINPFVPPSSCAADGSRVRVSSAMSRLRSSPQVTARCCTACVAAARDTPPAAVTPHVVAPPRSYGYSVIVSLKVLLFPTRALSAVVECFCFPRKHTFCSSAPRPPTCTQTLNSNTNNQSCSIAASIRIGSGALPDGVDTAVAPCSAAPPPPHAHRRPPLFAIK